MYVFFLFFSFFQFAGSTRYFILVEAVDGESEVYLRVRRCATGGLGWTREKRESSVWNLGESLMRG